MRRLIQSGRWIRCAICAVRPRPRSWYPKALGPDWKLCCDRCPAYQAAGFELMILKHRNELLRRSSRDTGGHDGTCVVFIRRSGPYGLNVWTVPLLAQTTRWPADHRCVCRADRVEQSCSTLTRSHDGIIWRSEAIASGGLHGISRRIGRSFGQLLETAMRNLEPSAP